MLPRRHPPTHTGAPPPLLLLLVVELDPPSALGVPAALAPGAEQGTAEPNRQEQVEVHPPPDGGGPERHQAGVEQRVHEGHYPRQLVPPRQTGDVRPVVHPEDGDLDEALRRDGDEEGAQREEQGVEELRPALVGGVVPEIDQK